MAGEILASGVSCATVEQASQAAEKVVYFVIPSEARNLSSI
jgi:hypothetical protein